MKILDTIGNTPLVRLENIEKLLNNKLKIYGKLEYLNPFGSVKDRAAAQIIADAEENGQLNSKATLIEATSGNMGVALSAICAIKGYACTVIMPENMSVKKQILIKSFGADLVLTDAAKGMAASLQLAEKMSKTNPQIYYSKQFENYSSVKAHKNTTAKEIYAKVRADIIIAGIGTGGTVSGIGQFFKGKFPSTLIVGLEPKGAPYITEGRTGKHNIQGIGAGFMPKILDMSVVDKVLTCSDSKAEWGCKLLAENEGIIAGHSSGAALAVCFELAKENRYSQKTAVLIFPDSAERYI